MSSGDRFYQYEFRHRPVLKGDIGSLLKIDGLVVGGNGVTAILLLPSAGDFDSTTIAQTLTDEEWSDWLQRSDVPEIMVGPVKAFHRKVRYEISGAVQQKVWVADGLKCQYCMAKIGDVQLTIDHFVPIELGGANNTSNYLTACRRCNKDKGSEDPKEYIKTHKMFGSFNVSYDTVLKYLEVRKIK